MEKTDARLVMSDPPCAYCEHLVDQGHSDSDGFVGWVCKAFPDGIPKRILRGEQSHTTKILNQEGDYIYKSKVYPFDDGNFKFSWVRDWIKVD